MAASVAYGRIAGKGYKLAVVSETHVPPGHVVSPRTQRAPGNGANQAGSFHISSPEWRKWLKWRKSWRKWRKWLKWPKCS